MVYFYRLNCQITLGRNMWFCFSILWTSHSSVLQVCLMLSCLTGSKIWKVDENSLSYLLFSNPFFMQKLLPLVTVMLSLRRLTPKYWVSQSTVWYVILSCCAAVVISSNGSVVFFNVEHKMKESYSLLINRTKIEFETDIRKCLLDLSVCLVILRLAL